MKRKIRNFAMLMACFCCCNLNATSKDAEGMQINYLSNKHCIIKVDEAKKYLLLPIEETAPESRVDVISNCERAAYL